MTTTQRLAVGQPAPAIDLLDDHGVEFTLRGALESAERGVVVYFYPKASTPGCTTEACDFRDSLSSLAAAGYAVVGVSPDPIEDLARFRDEQHLSFPLVSDEDTSVARAYGSFGEKTINGNTFEGTLRSTFVVGKDGFLTHAEYNVAADGHVRRLREELGL